MCLPARLAAPTSDPVTAANGKYVSASSSADTADVFTSSGGGDDSKRRQCRVAGRDALRHDQGSSEAPGVKQATFALFKGFLQTDAWCVFFFSRFSVCLAQKLG